MGKINKNILKYCDKSLKCYFYFFFGDIPQLFMKKRQNLAARPQVKLDIKSYMNRKLLPVFIESMS